VVKWPFYHGFLSPFQGWAITHSLICSFALRSFPLFSKEWLCDRSLNRSLKKSEWAIALYVALCKRAKERSLFCRPFEKSKWAIPLFKKATKRAIAISLFQKEQKSKNELIAHYQYEQILGNSFAHLLNPSSLIFKKAIVRSLAQSLFCCSFEKSEWTIALFVTLFKRATKRAIALPKRAKMSKK